MRWSGNSSVGGFRGEGTKTENPMRILLRSAPSLRDITNTYTFLLHAPIKKKGECRTLSALHLFDWLSAEISQQNGRSLNLFLTLLTFGLTVISAYPAGKDMTIKFKRDLKRAYGATVTLDHF
jgi:hypothetical protein